MAQMAKGANMLTGTFTVPDDASQTDYTLSFGKTFARYLYLIEMTEESKAALMASGQTGLKMYVCFAIYPSPMWNNERGVVSYMRHSISPSTLAITYGGYPPSSIDGASLTLKVDSITGNQSYLYRGYSYNYLILEIPE